MIMKNNRRFLCALAATAVAFSLGFELDEVTGEDWMMVTINAKQNSFAFVDATPTV